MCANSIQVQTFPGLLFIIIIIITEEYYYGGAVALLLQDHNCKVSSHTMSNITVNVSLQLLTTLESSTVAAHRTTI